MKKTAAILGILCLLVLSGCRPNETAGGGATAPVRPAETLPAESALPLEPVQTHTPPTDQPLSTEPPATLTAEALSARALEWSETYANRFAGYGAFHIDRAYWFAEYAGAAMETAFTADDGSDGVVRFLPNPEGAIAPADAAAQLLGQTADSLILVDRARMLEELSQRMAALAGDNLNEDAALDRFLKDAQYIPALMEDMWYCVNVDDTGYILMAHSGAYRLQRMAAMVEHADDPVLRVRMDFDRAVEAYGWFDLASMPTQPPDPTAPPEQGETPYGAVDYPGISSMLELRTHLKTLFSDEIVDALLGLGYYKDVNGVLYAAVFGGDPTPYVGAISITRESGTRVVYSRGADYVYELVGDQWLFTQFPFPA